MNFYIEVYTSLKCTANKSNRPGIWMGTLYRQIFWSEKIVLVQKFKEDPIMNVSIYLQTLPRDIFCGNAKDYISETDY